MEKVEKAGKVRDVPDAVKQAGRLRRSAVVTCSAWTGSVIAEESQSGVAAEVVIWRAEQYVGGSR
jgi:hypothetical protein